MRRTLLCASLAVLLFSCDKEKDEVTSNIDYTDLNDVTVTYTNHVNIDLNKDGVNDFYATSNLQEQNTVDAHLQFIISAPGANRIATRDEQVPKLMEKDEVITKANMDPFEWSSINDALIVERVMPLDLSQMYWQGTWKEKQNKYLPVQVVKDGKTYNGWIQVSFSAETNPYRIILHDAAVSKTPDVSIKAGQQ